MVCSDVFYGVLYRMMCGMVYGMFRYFLWCIVSYDVWYGVWYVQIFYMVYCIV